MVEQPDLVNVITERLKFLREHKSKRNPAGRLQRIHELDLILDAAKGGTALAKLMEEELKLDVMVVVTLDNGEERTIKLAEHSGYKQEDGKFRVTFKYGTSGIVTQNPAPKDEKTNIYSKRNIGSYSK